MHEVYGKPLEQKSRCRRNSNCGPCKVSSSLHHL